MTDPESPVSATVVTPAAQQSTSPRAGRHGKFFGSALRLSLAEAPDPPGKVSLGRIRREAGELQVGMRVDETGNQDRIVE